MMNLPLRWNRLEASVTVTVVLVVAAGAVLGAIESTALEGLLREDGLIEWLAVIGYVLVGALWLSRAIRLRADRSPTFVALLVLFGLVFLGIAGEEISWGQRVFGWESGEFFRNNNRQGETNLHNLLVNSTNINRVLSRIVGLLGVIYLVGVPIFYRRSRRLRTFIDRLAIPVPRLRQIVAIAVVALTVTTIQSPKRDELLESALPFLVLMVSMYPLNESLFRRNREPAP